jgi:cytochrome c-type biogenesis protein CcmH
MRPLSRLACAIALATFVLAAAATKMDAPADAAFDVRLKRLESELRCLVCQNQTLADSNASLADDLRREVRELALAGRSDREIRDYLVARYGDFVLYDPPLKRTTWLLWIGPFALLAAGGALWWTILRRLNDPMRRAASTTPVTDPGAEARGRALLQDSNEPPPAS